MHRTTLTTPACGAHVWQPHSVEQLATQKLRRGDTGATKQGENGEGGENDVSLGLALGAWDPRAGTEIYRRTICRGIHNGEEVLAGLGRSGSSGGGGGIEEEVRRAQNEGAS